MVFWHANLNDFTLNEINVKSHTKGLGDFCTGKFSRGGGGGGFWVNLLLTMDIENR